SKNHTYQLDCFIQCDGKWRVVSHDGNKVTVKMTMNLLGFKSDSENTATITIIDKDHIDFNANEPGFQLSSRLRRVGSGGRTPTPIGGAPFAGAGPHLDPNGPKMPDPSAPKPDPNTPGPERRGKRFDPNLDKGVVADCDVEWAGEWFEAKVLKTEKNRWF